MRIRCWSYSLALDETRFHSSQIVIGHVLDRGEELIHALVDSFEVGEGRLDVHVCDPLASHYDFFFLPDTEKAKDDDPVPDQDLPQITADPDLDEVWDSAPVPDQALSQYLGEYLIVAMIFLAPAPITFDLLTRIWAWTRGPTKT